MELLEKSHEWFVDLKMNLISVPLMKNSGSWMDIPLAFDVIVHLDLGKWKV